jgi:hypothetical protein
LVDVAGEDKAQDFGEDYLNGVGVFEGREVEGGLFRFVEIELVGAAAVLVVEETMPFGAQGGRSALDAVGLMCWQRGTARAAGVLVAWGVVDILCSWGIVLRSRFSVSSRWVQ